MRRRFVLPGTLLLSAALVLILAWQNRTLRERNLTLARMATEAYPGFVVPTVRATSITGDLVMLGEHPERGGRQVLLGFNTSCPYCLASLPAWETIAQAVQAAGTPTKVYGVSLDPLEATQAYVSRNHITYPVVLLSAKDPVLFRLGMVPSILVLDEYGRTTYFRVGALETSEAIDSVISVINAKPALEESTSQGLTRFGP